MKFEVISEMYSAGITEDGEEFVAEAYLVQATDEEGNRWNHPWTFPGVRVETDDEYGMTHFIDIRDESKAGADQLCIDVASIMGNLSDWHPTYPMYGSVAYQQYGQADEVAWEKEQS